MIHDDHYAIMGCTVSNGYREDVTVLNVTGVNRLTDMAFDADLLEKAA